MSIIKFKNITHAYGTKVVLRDLSLNFKATRLSCLLGSSGSGKTTILRLIAGLETPQSGQIIISGEPVTENGKIIVPPHRRNLGFIFQDLALWPHFTVYKNIAFGLSERKEKEVKQTVFDMLTFFGLQDDADKYPHQLSGGQQQLIAISRALVLKPKVLLMDEPLANLDVKLKRKILEHIKNLQLNFDLTLIYVTHDHKEAFAIADEIIVLNQGKIEDSGNPEHILETDNEYIKSFIEL